MNRLKRLHCQYIVTVVVKIRTSNQQSQLLGFLGTGPRTIKGRPAQTNRDEGPGRGRSKPLRRDGVMDRAHGSRRDPRKDEYGKISRRYRRHNWGDCHLERRGGGSTLAPGELMDTLTVAMASSEERCLARFYAERWTRFSSVKRVRRQATSGEIKGDQFCDGARATYLP
ncbi:hypothetical protein Acr_28g0003150 [Actinidia rufa]|uniref:Uncharacterized protein n=1 Tax=Actinidia rufa TaxID=165716 RepID=A0A7J0H914_9ERIC|nr:hypothetical protein Acr_28g0003150 [Actinidia rufa]